VRADRRPLRRLRARHLGPPYKKAWTPDEAFAEIARGKGSHFDPDLTDLFLSLREAVLEICRERDDPGTDPFVI
jgi:HD-GYP domain-containing protein (c-di-GMP phosphodiesterase class II)